MCELCLALLWSCRLAVPLSPISFLGADRRSPPSPPPQRVQRRDHDEPRQTCLCRSETTVRQTRCELCRVYATCVRVGRALVFYLSRVWPSIQVLTRFFCLRAAPADATSTCDTSHLRHLFQRRTRCLPTMVCVISQHRRSHAAVPPMTPTAMMTTPSRRAQQVRNWTAAHAPTSAGPESDGGM